MKLGKNFYVLILILSVIALSVSLIEFMGGIHTIDIAYNMLHMEARYNKTYIDLTNWNNTLTSEELYIVGSSNVIRFTVAIIISSLLIGYCVWVIKK